MAREEAATGARAADQDQSRRSVYASAEVHMSVPKALALLGVGRASLRAHRRGSGALHAHRRAGERHRAGPPRGDPGDRDRRDGRHDEHRSRRDREIAACARAHGLWLHVDGAYGGLAALAVPELFGGLSQADSISLDAHKWLYQPLDCSVLLYRERRRRPQGVRLHRRVRQELFR